VVRVDALDAEVAASGVTKQMEKDLQAEFGTREQNEEDSEDDEETGSEEEEEEDEELIEEMTENIEELRQQLEESVKIVEENLKSAGIEPKRAPSEERKEEEEENDEKSEEEEEDDVGNLREFNSRFKPFRDGQQPRQMREDDSCSVRSVSTTASTIGKSQLAMN
jgi:hypothetical protein